MADVDEYLNETNIVDLTLAKEGVLNLLLNLNTKESSYPDKIPNIFLIRNTEWAAANCLKAKEILPETAATNRKTIECDVSNTAASFMLVTFLYEQVFAFWPHTSPQNSTRNVAVTKT